VVGGRGYFGSLLIDDLLRHTDCELIVASRHPFHSERFETVVADIWNPRSLERALERTSVAICAAGPYQGLPLMLAKLCLERGIHYIDLADARGFVQAVSSIAADHNDTRSAVCTGWSTVSALSGLLARIATVGMTAIESIHIHMAPGNRGARRAATIASLMYSVGRPFTVFRNGRWQPVTGWTEPREFDFPPPVGKRRGYLTDVPDHEIFPALFGARTVEFRAGSELQMLNACLSLLRRTRRNWVPLSGLLQRTLALFSWMGHYSGAIGVEVSGSARRRVSVVADTLAERIAVMPASVMTDMLLSGSRHRGLVSYADWLTEGQLRHECGKRGFKLHVEEF
jgi:saccharopine dehydrogenase-like NADP-dependent oxidoreductase